MGFVQGISVLVDRLTVFIEMLHVPWLDVVVVGDVMFVVGERVTHDIAMLVQHQRVTVEVDWDAVLVDEIAFLVVSAANTGKQSLPHYEGLNV